MIALRQNATLLGSSSANIPCNSSPN